MLSGLGHEVKLVAPEAVRPFVKRGRKNDAVDAAALCEAASRPEVKFVPVKSPEQQATLALHSARSLLVKQRTMLANAMRGLAAEFGLTVPQGMSKLGELMALVDADEAVPERARQAIRGLLDHCRALGDSIETLEAEIVAHAARRDGAQARHDPRHRPDHRVPDRGDGHRHRRVQERPALRRLARVGAAAALHGRQDAPGSDHQSGQPGDTQIAGAGRHRDGLSGRAVEQRGRGLDQGRPGAPPGQAGDRGAGEQDGAPRLGGDDAQGNLPSERAGRGRGRGCGMTPHAGW